MCFSMDLFQADITLRAKLNCHLPSCASPTNISNFQRSWREFYRATFGSVWNLFFGKKSMLLLCLVVLVTGEGRENVC